MYCLMLTTQFTIKCWKYYFTVANEELVMNYNCGMNKYYINYVFGGMNIKSPGNPNQK